MEADRVKSERVWKIVSCVLGGIIVVEILIIYRYYDVMRSRGDSRRPVAVQHQIVIPEMISTENVTTGADSDNMNDYFIGKNERDDNTGGSFELEAIRRHERSPIIIGNRDE